MLALYLTALVLSGGVVAIQLFAGHGDAGGHDAGGHDGPDHGGGIGTFIASVRFWSFLLLAFGLVGTLLTVFGLAGPLLTFALALGSGLASGVFAVSVIRRLFNRGTSSNVRGEEVVGRIGRVIVPPATSGRGKVRVEVRGSVVDYVARSSEALDEGDPVIIEEYENSEIVVSRAPKELKEKE